MGHDTPLFHPTIYLSTYILLIPLNSLPLRSYILNTFYKKGGGGVWVQLLGGQGIRSDVILVLCECFWNPLEVSLFLPAFDDIDSLSSPPCWVFYLPGSMLGSVSRFLVGIGRLS